VDVGWPLLGELRVDRLDERDVLVDPIRSDLVSDHRAAHLELPGGGTSLVRYHLGLGSSP
jgi:hypothetical protein